MNHAFITLDVVSMDNNYIFGSFRIPGRYVQDRGHHPDIFWNRNKWIDGHRFFVSGCCNWFIKSVDVFSNQEEQHILKASTVGQNVYYHAFYIFCIHYSCCFLFSNRSIFALAESNVACG